MPIFTGSGVALVTPFDNDGVNYEVFGRLIDFQLQNKTDAIIVAGTTGEGSTIAEDEYGELLAYAVNRVGGRVPVIAGTGCNNTKRAARLMKIAEGCGADAALAVTPYYNKATQKGLLAYYQALLDAADMPLLAYNVPTRTGVNIQPATALELSKLGVAGLKEANASIEQIMELFRVCADRLDVFDIYSGCDEYVFPMLALGARGVISVMANVIPAQTHDMVAHFMAGETALSRAEQYKYYPLIKALFLEVNPIPVKKALELMGFAAGIPRPPLTELEEGHIGALLAELRKLELIS